VRRAAIEEQNRDLLRDSEIFASRRMSCATPGRASPKSKPWPSSFRRQDAVEGGSTVPRNSVGKGSRSGTNAPISIWRCGSTRSGGSAICAGAPEKSLARGFEAGVGISVVGHQLDVFLFEPASDRYLGRLCHSAPAPKAKLECLVLGCGATRSTGASRISLPAPTSWPGRAMRRSIDAGRSIAFRSRPADAGKADRERSAEGFRGDKRAGAIL